MNGTLGLCAWAMLGGLGGPGSDTLGSLRQEGLPAQLRGVRIQQRLDAQVPADLAFRDEEDRPVRLGDYFGSKPLILVLAYYRCPMLCTQVLNGLVAGLQGIPGYRIGREFNVLTVSFDPADTPQVAAKKKANYVQSYGEPGAEAGWHFLTGPQASISRLAEAVGFYYNYDPASKQFVHASGIMLLTPQGKVARYFYGIAYRPGDLRLGLVEASQRKIGGPVDAVLLYCYHYDATAGKYTADVLALVRVAGAVTVVALGAMIFGLWRRERYRLPAAAAAARREP